MAAAKTFHANPHVLVWARERWGLDQAQASEKLQLSEAALNAMESGRSQPTFELLEQMTKVYQISLTSLIVSDPPPAEPMPRDFRTVGGRAPRLSTEVMQAITLTREDRQEATYIGLDLNEQIPPALPQVTTEDDPGALGVELREQLGVSDDDQLSWNDAYEALREWRRPIEQRGILIFIRRMPRNDCRGFALWSDDQMPAITVSSREAPEARCFTIMHEYAHLLLRTSSICTETEDGDEKSVERFCNSFAAAALMPESLVRGIIDPPESTMQVDAWVPRVNLLARRLRVSREAAAIRLNELLSAPRQLIDKAKSGRDDDTTWLDDEGSNGGNYYRSQASRLGWRYTSLVVNGLRRGVIDIIDAADAMEVQAAHITEIARLLDINTDGIAALQ